MRASLVAQLVKNPPAIQETSVWSLGWEDPLEKGTATQYSGLENSMGYTVHEVTKNQTQLWDFHFHFLSTYFLPHPAIFGSIFISLKVFSDFFLIFFFDHWLFSSKHLTSKYLWIFQFSFCNYFFISYHHKHAWYFVSFLKFIRLVWECSICPWEECFIDSFGYLNLVLIPCRKVFISCISI